MMVGGGGGLGQRGRMTARGGGSRTRGPGDDTVMMMIVAKPPANPCVIVSPDYVVFIIIPLTDHLVMFKQMFWRIPRRHKILVCCCCSEPHSGAHNLCFLQTS